MELDFKQLLPLADLLEARGITSEEVGRLIALLGAGQIQEVVSRLGGDIARDCLQYAGVINDRGTATPTHEAYFTAAAALALLREQRDTWEPVVTLPATLRSLLPDTGYLETAQVLRRIVVNSKRELILAAPFLDSGIEDLFPAVADLVAEGGTCLLITRDLVAAASKGRNRPVVDSLRRMVADRARLRVESWSGEGLGVHMKVVVGDREMCYIGSANLTHGGLERNLEVGVYCEGAGVARVADFMAAIADGLKVSRMPAAR